MPRLLFLALFVAACSGTTSDPTSLCLTQLQSSTVPGATRAQVLVEPYSDGGTPGSFKCALLEADPQYLCCADEAIDAATP